MFWLSPEQSHQVQHVLRLEAGDTIVVLDDTGTEYDVTLKTVDKRQTIGQVTNSQPARGEPTAAGHALSEHAHAGEVRVGAAKGHRDRHRGSPRSYGAEPRADEGYPRTTSGTAGIGSWSRPRSSRTAAESRRLIRSPPSPRRSPAASASTAVSSRRLRTRDRRCAKRSRA